MNVTPTENKRKELYSADAVEEAARRLIGAGQLTELCPGHDDLATAEEICCCVFCSSFYEESIDMKFTMTNPGVPAGTYPCDFKGAEDFEGNGQFGPALKLEFEIKAGEQAGKTTDAVCSQRFSPKSKLGKFAAALNGGVIPVGEEFDFAKHLGTTGVVVVEENDAGYGRVTSFIRDSADTVPF